MLDVRKSLNAILYERVTSPFYGTLIISWILWNWKAVYITILESKESLGMSKFEYISEHLYYDYWWLNWSFYLVFPLISTVVLLLYFPRITNYFLAVSLEWKKEANDARSEIEKLQLITIEEYSALRIDIDKQDEQFNNSLKEKNKNIEALKTLNEKIKNQHNEAAKKINDEHNLTKKKLQDSINAGKQLEEANTALMITNDGNKDELFKTKRELKTALDRVNALLSQKQTLENQLSNANKSIDERKLKELREDYNSSNYAKEIIDDKTKSSIFMKIIESLQEGELTLNKFNASELDYFIKENIIIQEGKHNYYHLTDLGVKVHHIFLAIKS